MGRVGAGGPVVAAVVVAICASVAWSPPGGVALTEVATAANGHPPSFTSTTLPAATDPAVTESAPSSSGAAPLPTVRPAFVPPATETTDVPSQPSITISPPPDSLAAPRVAPVITTDPAELALERMRFDWTGRFPEWEVSFLGSRSGLRALTYPHERRIEVFVRSSDTAESLHRVLAHEIGHLVDVELNTNADRDRWRAQRALSPSVPWWPDDSDPDFASGAGDFAEAFAVWEAGITSQSTVAGQPTAADIDLLRELVTG